MLINSIFHQLKDLRGRHFGRRSFSQCGEDLIVRHIFHCLGQEKIKYIDVGAHHPYWLSNTAFFYRSGSSGINIEPNPAYYKLFEKERKRDVNLNCGVSDQAGKLKFFVMEPHVLSTFSASEANELVQRHHHKIQTEMVMDVHTITDILARYHGDQFPDFMSLDVEGLDLQILRSLSLQEKRPTVICVETISYSTHRDGVKNVEIIGYLKDKGYFVYADTNINTIFVDDRIWRDGKK